VIVMIYVVSLKGICAGLSANVETGGILKSKSPNAQHRTPISLTTLQATITLSGNAIPIRKAKDVVKVLVMTGVGGS
jgi:hypothetical protein